MSKEIGTLVVVVLKARNLHDNHSLYKQDVYAQVSISHKTKHTAIDVKGGQHPVWDEELRFPIYEASSGHHRTLDVSCWSKEPRSAEVLGKGTVDVSETLRTGEFDDWIRLELEGVYCGDLYLEMTYFASGPPPLQRRPSKMPQSERLTRPSQPYASTGTHTPPLTPPKSLFPVRPSPARQDQPHSASTSPTGAHLVPLPTSTHSSPGTRLDALPPIPEGSRLKPESIPTSLRAGPGKLPISHDHPLPPESIPASLRAGSGKSRSPSPSDHPLPPVPPEHPVHARLPVSPPNSPPRATLPALPPRAQPSSGLVYGPPPSLRTGPLQQRESRPYPYNYPPAPPAEPHSPHPIVSARIPMPVPLPDEPSGLETPTPSNPKPHLAAPDLRKAALGVGATPRVSNRHARTPSKEERDRQIALEAEHEEEERRKEQEALDFELARKLDLELNLPPEEDLAPTAPPTTHAGAPSMPGGW